MSDTTKSINVNKDILISELGFKQLANTSIYIKDDFFLLSPSVQNQSKWFDLRKVNLDKLFKRDYNGYLLIRYFNKFLITDINKFIDIMIPKDKHVYTKSIGIHWKFNIETNGNEFIIINRQDKSKVLPIKEAQITELKRIFN